MFRILARIVVCNLFVAILFVGCTSQSGSQSAGDELFKAMSSLSDGDRELALKQKICPVSDEPLGSMGPPFKVQVQDQSVFLCCAGCEADFRSDPDKFIATLNTSNEQ